jgi:ankyrin repeat protein
MQCSPLYLAAMKGRVEVVVLLLEHGADVSTTDNDGAAPLHIASPTGHVSVCSILLEKGADVAVKRDDGGTPLHYAAFHGHATVVQLLFDKGADVQAKTNGGGGTPEDLATAGKHLQVAAMLKTEAERRAKYEAFAMGQLQRLGAGSRVRWLDPGVLRMILEQV